jgi:pentatricopeptide repeat protein
MPELQQYDNRKGLVRMKMKKHPPYYKLPSDIKSKGLLVKRPRRDEVISKLEWEKDKDWSLSLTAAFAFAESLTYGACGHDPIKLDVTSWNTLIKACCYRGAFLRALHILNDVMPKNGLQPDSYTYNTILSGLARVGDKDYMREMLITMTNKNIPVDKYTVQAMVDGYLNSGDISGAVTLVQDMFNQHQALPPCNTHLKIIEFALSNDLVFEAKRHVYFIQQLWKWKSPLNSSTSGGEGWKKLETAIFVTRNNTKLSRSSLQRLFGYFGEELLDSDFF